MDRKKVGGDTAASGPPMAAESEGATSEEAAASSPLAAEHEIEELKQELQEAQEEARKHYDLFLRERAELENFKRRMQREKSEALRFASEPLIRELLPVIDNLHRAIAHAQGNGQSVIEGVRLVLNSLQEVLAHYGVTRIEATGKRFDPTVHEAMAQVESTEHEPNHVVEEHHSGYLLHDRLLRPALVTVSGRKSDAAVESEPNND